MRLGWSLASGVVAVSLWWMVRLACRGSTLAVACTPRLLGVLGLLTAFGVLLPMQMAQPHTAHASLLALALLWGVWSALIDTRTQVSTFSLGPFAWHPLAAAGLVAAVWRMPAAETFSVMGVSLLLALCAAVLYLRELITVTALPPCHGPADQSQALLAPSAMGLMMGTLWLGNAWCSALGWTTEDMVFAHLLLMAGLPSVLALLIACLGRGRWSTTMQSLASLGLLLLGSLMLLGNSVVSGVLVMVLPSLAWAVHCTRLRSPEATSGLAGAWAVRSQQLLLGPVLLLGVGLATPSHGPWAMQAALALLGALSAGALIAMAWRAHSPNPAFSTPR